MALLRGFQVSSRGTRTRRVPSAGDVRRGRVRSFRPSPTELTNLTLTSEQVLAGLNRPAMSLPSAAQLYRLMEHGPAFFVAGRGAADSQVSSWHWSVDRQVLAYDGVEDVPEYARRIVVEYAEPSRRVPGPALSPQPARGARLPRRGLAPPPWSPHAPGEAPQRRADDGSRVRSRDPGGVLGADEHPR